MKKILALSLLVATMASSAFATVTIDAGVNAFTPIPACGQYARAKAIYSRTTGALTLRVCDNVAFSCMFPVLLNTNAKYDIKQGTQVYASKFSAGVAVNGSCQDFNMNFTTQAGQRNLRAKIGQQQIDISLF